jgi:hypothetical protein
MLVLVINFLARIARIGNVTTAIKNLIQRIRTPVERGLDRVVAFVMAQARKLGKFVVQAGVPNDPAKRLELAANHAVTLARPLAGKATAPLLTGALGLLKTRYALTGLAVREEGDDWVAEISINPKQKKNLGVGGKKAKGGANGSPAAAAAGPDWGPIIAKLDQAVTMFTEWAASDASSVGKQVLGKLRAARTKAKALAADQKAGKTGLVARRTALGAELRTIQALDPGYELVSIGELEVTIKTARKKMPAKTLSPFTMLDPTWRSIYVEQLAAQQAGMNAMTLSQMEDNKDLFAAQGRGKREKKLRREFNKRSGNQPGTAAPHNPDKGWALGFDDPTGEPADAPVNSHIGSQGRTKKQEIVDAVMAVKSLARLVTQANFRLVVQ